MLRLTIVRSKCLKNKLKERMAPMQMGFFMGLGQLLLVKVQTTLQKVTQVRVTVLVLKRTMLQCRSFYIEMYRTKIVRKKIVQ